MSITKLKLLAGFIIERAFWIVFFREEVGELTYRLKIYKYPESVSISRNRNKARMSEYISYFLHTLLEGERGSNTHTRKSYPNESEEQLTNMLIETPKVKKVVLGETEWLNFRIYTPPSRIDFTDYYFTPLNDEFALSFEWIPIANHNRKRERKEVEATNQKAIELMKNSISLEFH